MRRFSFWPALVFVLVGLLLLREPRWQRLEEDFLRWMLSNSPPRPIKIPLTVVDIGLGSKSVGTGDARDTSLHDRGTMVSPLEYALFLQSVLDFEPTVVAFDNILHWRTRDKDQEQVFLDQAMRVPKLLLATELTNTPDPDAPAAELPSFKQVTGSRRDLPEFAGIGRQPSEDLRLISTPGFINLPNETGDDLRVPLLFRYRSEIIPAFALEAVLLWLRVTPDDVKIDLRSYIALPGNRTIPIRSDGTILISPGADEGGRHVTLNELLLAAQQRGRGGVTNAHLEDMRDQIVLARTPLQPLAPAGVFADTIATIQGGKYLHRVSRLFDLSILLLAALFLLLPLRLSRLTMFLGAIVLTAGYCLVALAFLRRLWLWLPGYLPLCALWSVVLLRSFLPRRRAPVPPDETSSVVPSSSA